MYTVCGNHFQWQIFEHFEAQAGARLQFSQLPALSTPEHSSSLYICYILQHSWPELGFGSQGKISQKCLGLWTQQNTKGLELKVLIFHPTPLHVFFLRASYMFRYWQAINATFKNKAKNAVYIDESYTTIIIHSKYVRYKIFNLIFRYCDDNLIMVP
jgi:hypothetical protein